MSLVRIRNVSADRTYTLKHDEHGDHVIGPGASKVANLEVATVNLGNPGARNYGPAAPQRERDNELKRIQTIWGYYSGLHSDDAWTGVGIDKISGTAFGPKCPQVEVYDFDSDERIWMIHDDPAGVHRSDAVADRVVDASTRAVDTELAALQEQVRRLTDIVAAQAQATQGAEPPVDPASPEAKIAAALTDDGTQAERNAARFDIPKPAPEATVGRDRPRTSRSGSRVTAAG